MRGGEGAVFSALKSKKNFAFRYAKHRKEGKRNHGADKTEPFRP